MDWKQIALSVVLVANLLTVVHGLRCYQCSGQTNYDPDHCFDTEAGKTIVTECNTLEKNVACEKRVERIDRRSTVINRGCTVNCNDRGYVYTDEFQVYCCTTDSCNAAGNLAPNVVIVSLIAALGAVLTMTVLRMDGL